MAGRVRLPRVVLPMAASSRRPSWLISASMPSRWPLFTMSEMALEMLKRPRISSTSFFSAAAGAATSATLRRSTSSVFSAWTIFSSRVFTSVWISPWRASSSVLKSRSSAPARSTIFWSSSTSWAHRDGGPFLCWNQREAGDVTSRAQLSRRMGVSRGAWTLYLNFKSS